MGVFSNSVQHVLEDFRYVTVGKNRLDTGGRLQRVGRVGDNDPVPMAEERKAIADFLLPSFSNVRGRNGSEGW
jgi:hypothetical protein